MTTCVCLRTLSEKPISIVTRSRDRSPLAGCLTHGQQMEPVNGALVENRDPNLPNSAGEQCASAENWPIGRPMVQRDS